MATNRFICLVDDDADYQFIIETFFQQTCPDYQIRPYSGGKALIGALSQMRQLPSLILLDRHMPEFDGHQTLEFLKQHPAYQKIPVVMMSAHATQEEIDGCYASGVNSFLSKSRNAISLREAIATICQYWLEFNLVPSTL